MVSLSHDILDAIDGAEETKGRDSRYQEWADRAKAMEDALLAALPFMQCGIDTRPGVSRATCGIIDDSTPA